jgi:hypothetical protein
VPSDEELVANGAVIGTVYVQTDNIFDPERPGEDRLVFEIANRAHFTTRPKVVERKLLFREGDAYDPRLLQESERYLRSLDYLYDAKIEPIRYQDNRVDVLVRTRDVWTLGLGAGFERTGGANSLQAQLSESNLLGTGRFLDVKYSDDPDRSSSRLRFVDTSLFGTRAELRLWYASNSDGHRRIFDLARPFYSLDTRWGGAFKVIEDQRIERIYRQGDVIQRFYHETTYAEVWGGLSKGYRQGRTRRWLYGYTYELDRFFEQPDSVDGLVPDAVTPRDFIVSEEHQLSYLWIGIEQVADGFIEVHNMDQLNRTEDFNLGLQLRARLGLSSAIFGADQERAIFDAEVRDGWSPRPGHTLLASVHAGGRWGEEGAENTVVGGELRYFWRNFGRHRLHFTVQADAAWELDPDNQLRLGGDNGLRGYPLRFQDGDRRFLVTLEQRFYTNWELFKLVHVGAAVFFDVGRAWYVSGPEAGKDRGLLRDVGFGLRLGSSRSSQGRVVHLDVAFPLDGDSRDVQWLVTSKTTF